MKIEKINKIKNHRCFNDFSWHSALDNFGRYNLLYGWNGTGKTTLANLFRAIEKQQFVPEGEIKIVIDNRTVDLNNISTEPNLPQVRVFNEDFVTENVFTSHGSITPIFYLGKENIEKQKKIKELEPQIELKREELGEKQKIKSDKETELDNYCRDRANNTIKPLLSSSGINPYNNYNKTNFKNKCEELSKERDWSSNVLDDSTKDKLKQQKDSTPKKKILKLSFVFHNFELLQSEVKDILDQTVLSQVIEELRNDQELANWVKVGLEKHKKEDIETCLFCGQRLPENRITELEAHFNDQYKIFMLTIDQKIESLEKQVKNCDLSDITDEAKLYDHLAEKYEEAVSELNKQVSLQKEALQELKNQLETKKSQPFQSVALTFSQPDIDRSKLNDVNNIIEKHDKETDDFEKSVEEARKKIEKSVVAESLPAYLKKKEAIGEAGQPIPQVQDEIDKLESQIQELEKEIVEHSKPAEELNNDLANYLGRNDIKFKIMETGYQILRKDKMAGALSEGEKSAIAFLYFLKSLSDKNFDLGKGIVVVDDPASSLDSNALFYAFSFMKARTKEAGQLFILTHNFAFFRQVKNWFRHLKGQNKRDVEKRPARFYMIKRVIESDGYCSTIAKIDPLLERYESEYHYLFSLVFYGSQKPSDASLQNYYHLPNVARRVIEAFLSFKRPRYAGELQKQLDSIDFDSEKKTRILRFLHTHSHSGQIDEPEHDLSILSETPDVLADILDLIKSEDPKHYEEMTSILGETMDMGDAS